MNTPESLFVEAWKAGVVLTINGDKLHFEARSKPSNELLNKLKDHKPELMRFLSSWIDTPQGQAKFAFFLGEFRSGVVLRHQPDHFTLMQKSQLGLKEDSDEWESVKH